MLDACDGSMADAFEAVAAFMVTADDVPDQMTFVLKFTPDARTVVDHLVGLTSNAATTELDKKLVAELQAMWAARRETGTGYTTMEGRPIIWQLFAGICTQGYETHKLAPLKTAAKNIGDRLAGKAKRPSRAKPIMSEIQIAGLRVLLRGFNEKDEYDVKDFRYCQSVIERSVKKIRDTYGVKVWPTVEIDFKKMPPAQGTYYTALTKLVLWAKGNNTGHIEEGIKTFVHEYGHFVMNNYLDKKTKQAWIDLVEADKVSVNMRDIAAHWKEGENVSAFLDRLKKEDPLLAVKAEYVLLYLNKGKYLPTREELLKSNKVVRLSQHPVTPYGHTDPEEAFCEAFGNLVAYGPRTVHPLILSWMKLVLPESSVHAAVELLDEAAQRIEAAPVPHMDPEFYPLEKNDQLGSERNLAEFMAWYKKETTAVMAGKRMWPGYPAKKVLTQLGIYEDMIEISTIQSSVQGKGHATQVLKQIIDAADKFGVKLILEAVPFNSYDRDGTETERLVRWYKQFGFKGDADMMIREPVIPPWKQPKPIEPKVGLPKTAKPTKPKTWGSPG